MKVHLELEIEPEELRRLVGLPDMQPIWDSVQKRVAEGDSEAKTKASTTSAAKSSTRKTATSKSRARSSSNRSKSSE